MRSGDVVLCDFGHPIGSEPGFVRPAVVVTADDVLRLFNATLHVVPCTTNVARNAMSDVTIDGLAAPTVAQCHLGMTVSRQRLAGESTVNVGPVVLRQIREVIGDLLDI